MTNKQYTANDIERLDGLKPAYYTAGMYISYTDERGKQNCINEVLDNSVDEHHNGSCTEITITLHKDDSITVADNGRGIPTDINPKYNKSGLEMVLEELHSGGKFGKKLGLKGVYENSGGIHGVGVSVVNGVSEWLTATVFRDGKIYQKKYAMGLDSNGNKNPAQPLTKLEVIGTCPKNKTGTTISFKLDKDLFSSVETNEETGEQETIYYQFNADSIKQRLVSLACLNPNLKLCFIDENIEYHDEAKQDGILTILSENGHIRYEWKANTLGDYLDILYQGSAKKATDIIELSETVDITPDNDEKITVNCALQWYSEGISVIHCFTNNIYNIQGGTHLDGFKDGLYNAITKYVKNTGSEKEQKDFDGVNKNDVIDGMVAVISIKMNQPQFSSQTKEYLSTKNVKRAVNNAIVQYFAKFLEENPTFSSKIIHRIVLAKKARMAADKARKEVKTIKTKAKFATPTKLAAANSNDAEQCEIFIVEGDSAGGSAKAARDKNFQAVLPIRGKILNTQGKKLSAMLQSQEIKDLLIALGLDGKYDKSKLNYHKIIYLTDADEDGKHISILLTTLFYNLCPELFINKHIYLAKPPLFSVRKQNSKPIYLKNVEELEKFKKTHNMAQWKVSRFKGLGEMNPDQLRETTMDITTRELECIELNENNGNIMDIFEKLMGNDTDRRKEFLSEYCHEK